METNTDKSNGTSGRGQTLLITESSRPAIPVQVYVNATMAMQLPAELAAAVATLGFCWEQITPADAQRYLDTNSAGQRRIDKSKAAGYAKSMTGGKWYLCFDPVVFDQAGRLINGQHRCFASVMSGVTFLALVIRNAPADALLSMDRGKPRNAIDLAKVYRGTDISKNEMAIARRMLLGNAETSEGMLADDLMAFAIDNMDVIRPVCEWLRDAPRGVRTSAVSAVVARAMRTRDRAKVEEFATVLRTGISSAPEHEVIILLRETLRRIAEGGYGGGALPAEIYRKTERGLVAFLRGERLLKIYEQTTEAFPLPSGK